MRTKLGFICQDIGALCARHDCQRLAYFFARCEAIINPDNVGD